MADRKDYVKRKTKETNVDLELVIDGRGKAKIKCEPAFFGHMLELFTRHGLFDLKIAAAGDLAVDDHHLVEDVGICIGKALREGLGDKRGITRYGFAQVPMDEALVEVAVDLGGRAYFVYKVQTPAKKVKKFDVQLVEEFLRALAFEAGMNLHVRMIYGRNTHHIIEAVFKALGRALDAASRIDPRVQGVPSTKGKL